MNMQNLIDKDELIGIAIQIDAMKAVLDDLIENFFGSFDPKEDDPRLLAYQYDNARGKANAVHFLLCHTDKDLKDCGVYI